ncbi:Nucleoside recognition [anaerobic digester metagenome]
MSRNGPASVPGAACAGDARMALPVQERWDLVDAIARKTVTAGVYRQNLGDVLGDLTVRPLTGISVAVAVLYAFWSIFSSFAGALVTDGFMVKAFDNYWLPWLQEVWPDPASIHYFLFVGDPLAENCFEAFGMLTSGLFVSIGVVLPAVLIFYLMMTVLEDSGYLPRLAVLMDTVFHRIGLHGYAIVPVILGLGCNAPAVTATRVLETRKQRFIMMTLLAIFIPCGAQLGVMLEVIPDAVGWVMLFLLIGFGIFGFILDRIIPGSNPEILIDVPPYHWPLWENVAKKLMNRTKSFLKDAVPFVLFGVLVVNVLYLAGIIGALADLFEPLFVTWFGVPKETVGPLIAAFLRKDLAVAQLSAIAMTPYQMITAVVLVSIYFPCVATFVVMLREGWKELAAAVAVLVATVFIYGGLIHAVGILMGVA